MNTPPPKPQSIAPEVIGSEFSRNQQELEQTPDRFQHVVEALFFHETPALANGLGLIDWLTTCCCMSRISNRFLFE